MSTDVDEVAALGGALHRRPALALHAQVLDHAVDVLVVHFGGVANHVELGGVDVAEIRNQLEIGDVGQLAFSRGFIVRNDARIAGDAQVLAFHGLAEAFAQHAVEDFAADLVAVAIVDHAGRHLARAETLDAGVARDFAQA